MHWCSSSKLVQSIICWPAEFPKENVQIHIHEMYAVLSCTFAKDLGHSPGLLFSWPDCDIQMRQWNLEPGMGVGTGLYS